MAFHSILPKIASAAVSLMLAVGSAPPSAMNPGWLDGPVREVPAAVADIGGAASPDAVETVGPDAPADGGGGIGTGTLDGADGQASGGMPETGEPGEEDAGEPDEDGFKGRLLVGISDLSRIRPGDVVLGSWGDAVLLGFETISELSDAKAYYEEIARFASVDGRLSVAEGEVLEVDADEPSSVPSFQPVAMGGDSLSIASTLEGEPPRQAPGSPPLIALIDTGVYEDDDVEGKVSVIDSDPIDRNGHGNAMLGFIRDEFPQARVLSVKALDSDGAGTVSSVYSGIEYAIGEGAQIINLSFSARAANGCPAIQAAIDDAVAAGCIVIAAAGNGGEDAALYCPGNADGAICVGAADDGWRALESSNRGERVDLWVRASSTSAAAARVSAWAARHGTEGWDEDIVASGGIARSRVDDQDEYGDAGAEDDEMFRAAAQTSIEPGYTYSLKCYHNGLYLRMNGTVAEVSDSHAVYFVGGSSSNDSYAKWYIYTSSGDYSYIRGNYNGSNQWMRTTWYFSDRVGLNTESSASSDGTPEWYISNGSYSTNEYHLYLKNKYHNNLIVCLDNGNSYINNDSAYYAGNDGNFAFVPVCTTTINNMRSVSVSGTASYGSTLSASLSSHLYGARLTYQWKRGGSNISGATGSSYTLTTADIGKSITCTMTDARGIYPGSVTSAAKTVATPSYYIDVNGYLNGANNGGVSPMGTFDMYVNNSLVANDVTDYYAQHPYGASWKIQDIKASTGYQYNGVKEGSLTGTLGTSNVQAARLNFSSKVLTITLNNQSATSAGSTAVYEKYNVGVYKESGCTNKMTSSANAISKPSRSYTVTYNYNGSGASNTTATATYTFGGYYTSTGGGGTQRINANGYLATFGATAYSANGTLYAKWTGGSVTLPSPTRTGYTFGGWYKESGCTNKVGNGGAGYSPTAAITLYAKWTANTYTVSYNGNGATGGSTAASSHTYNASKALTSNGFSRTGYDFAGWSTNSAGTGTTYTNGQSVSNLTTSNGATVPLYAQWAKASCDVVFDANGGEGGKTYSAQAYGGSVSVPSAKRAGYRFAGWVPVKHDDDTYVEVLFHYPVKAGFGNASGALAKADRDAYSRLGSLSKLKGANGKWQFKLCLDDLPGQSNEWRQSSDPSTTTTVSGFEAVNLSWNSSDFKGLVKNDTSALIAWTTASNNWWYGLGMYSAGRDPVVNSSSLWSLRPVHLYVKSDSTLSSVASDYSSGVSPGGTVPVRAEDQRFKAKWLLNEFSLTFDPNDGSSTPLAEGVPASYEQSVVAPIPEHQPEGCEFAGWNTEADGSGVLFEAGQPIEHLDEPDGAAVTLYAQWRLVGVPTNIASLGASGAFAWLLAALSVIGLASARYLLLVERTRETVRRSLKGCESMEGAGNWKSR